MHGNELIAVGYGIEGIGHLKKKPTASNGNRSDRFVASPSATRASSDAIDASSGRIAASSEGIAAPAEGIVGWSGGIVRSSGGIVGSSPGIIGLLARTAHPIDGFAN
jgi:hypothetical protein